MPRGCLGRPETGGGRPRNGRSDRGVCRSMDANRPAISNAVGVVEHRPRCDRYRRDRPRGSPGPVASDGHLPPGAVPGRRCMAVLVATWTLACRRYRCAVCCCGLLRDRDRIRPRLVLADSMRGPTLSGSRARDARGRTARLRRRGDRLSVRPVRSRRRLMDWPSDRSNIEPAEWLVAGSTPTLDDGARAGRLSATLRRQGRMGRPWPRHTPSDGRSPTVRPLPRG